VDYQLWFHPENGLSEHRTGRIQVVFLRGQAWQLRLRRLHA
jgi:hypothetical protein